MMNPHDTVVRSDTDLFRLWQSLMGDGGFGRRSLWLLFLDDDGRPEPVVVPIDDIPTRPNARFVDGLDMIIKGVRADGCVASVAVLLSRPGPQDMTEEDRAWARALRDTGSAAGQWPMHLATTDRMQVFAADDLVA